MVGSSEEEAPKYLELIESILIENYENDLPALIRKPLNDEKIIYLFLDTSEFIDWQALVKNGENHFLFLEEDFVVEIISK